MGYAYREHSSKWVRIFFDIHFNQVLTVRCGLTGGVRVGQQPFSGELFLGAERADAASENS